MATIKLVILNTDADAKVSCAENGEAKHATGFYETNGNG
jgi:hypothetical protein